MKDKYVHPPASWFFLSAVLAAHMLTPRYDG